MNVEVGAIVEVEGSDTTWVVTSINKHTCSLQDTNMGIIELEDIPIDDITDVVSTGGE